MILPYIPNKTKLLFVFFLFCSFASVAQIKDKEVLLRLELSQDTLVVGELTYLNLVIYTKVDIEETEIVSELTSGSNYKFYIEYNHFFKNNAIVKELDGEKYICQVLRQYILCPILEGEDTIQADFQVNIVRNSNDGVTLKSNLNDLKKTNDLLKLKKSYPITISALPEDIRFAPKNGLTMLVQFNDSLSDKGIWIADIEYNAITNPILIKPVNFDLGKKATVEIELIENGYKEVDGFFCATRTFRHIISFHEKGDYYLTPEWSTWNTQKEGWKTIRRTAKKITVTNTRFRKTNLTNIAPIVQDTNVSEDIVFLVDASTSMLAQDFPPNRYEAVKIILKKMIANKTANQQMSIVIFSGECMVLCPLTTDTFKLFAAVDALILGKLDNGTAIGTSIVFGLYELSKSSSPNKHLLMLTDGVNNAGYYNPQFASHLANELNIQVHSLGVGCNGKALTPVAQTPDGSFVFDNVEVEIDELILQTIGKQTGGNYTRITCNSDFTILNNLQELIKKPYSKTPNSTKIPNGFIEVIWRDIQFQNERSIRKYYASNE